MAIIKYHPGDSNKNPLWEEILKFSKNKIVIAVVLILVSVTGIIIPVIPGIVFFVLAIALLRKGMMPRFRRRFRLWRNNKH